MAISNGPLGLVDFFQGRPVFKAFFENSFQGSLTFAPDFDLNKTPVAIVVPIWFIGASPFSKVFEGEVPIVRRDKEVFSGQEGGGSSKEAFGYPGFSSPDDFLKLVFPREHFVNDRIILYVRSKEGSAIHPINSGTSFRVDGAPAGSTKDAARLSYPLRVYVLKDELTVFTVELHILSSSSMEPVFQEREKVCLSEEGGDSTRGGDSGLFLASEGLSFKGSLFELGWALCMAEDGNGKGIALRVDGISQGDPYRSGGFNYPGDRSVQGEGAKVFTTFLLCWQMGIEGEHGGNTEEGESSIIVVVNIPSDVYSSPCPVVSISLAAFKGPVIGVGALYGHECTLCVTCSPGRGVEVKISLLYFPLDHISVSFVGHHDPSDIGMVFGYSRSEDVNQRTKRASCFDPPRGYIMVSPRGKSFGSISWRGNGDTSELAFIHIQVFRRGEGRLEDSLSTFTLRELFWVFSLVISVSEAQELAQFDNVLVLDWLYRVTNDNEGIVLGWLYRVTNDKEGTDFVTMGRGRRLEYFERSAPTWVALSCFLNRIALYAPFCEARIGEEGKCKLGSMFPSQIASKAMESHNGNRVRLAVSSRLFVFLKLASYSYAEGSFPANWMFSTPTSTWAKEVGLGGLDVFGVEDRKPPTVGGRDHRVEREVAGISGPAKKVTKECVGLRVLKGFEIFHKMVVLSRNGRGNKVKRSKLMGEPLVISIGLTSVNVSIVIQAEFFRGSFFAAFCFSLFLAAERKVYRVFFSLGFSHPCGIWVGGFRNAKPDSEIEEVFFSDCLYPFFIFRFIVKFEGYDVDYRGREGGRRPCKGIVHDAGDVLMSFLIQDNIMEYRGRVLHCLVCKVFEKDGEFNLSSFDVSCVLQVRLLQGGFGLVCTMEAGLLFDLGKYGYSGAGSFISRTSCIISLRVDWITFVNTLKVMIKGPEVVGHGGGSIGVTLGIFLFIAVGRVIFFTTFIVLKEVPYLVDHWEGAVCGVFNAIGKFTPSVSFVERSMSEDSFTSHGIYVYPKRRSDSEIPGITRTIIVAEVRSKFPNMELEFSMVHFGPKLRAMFRDVFSNRFDSSSGVTRFEDHTVEVAGMSSIQKDMGGIPSILDKFLSHSS
ncbi:unnamed protein product [Polarella glacialis]|uniref:Uncharacterized protein n=1 Tax=Polarella glacialis TaxID=89957 RepID=A0A813JRC9_POLGL|nr:unnamed protein product [Polarella glacialis]